MLSFSRTVGLSLYFISRGKQTQSVIVFANMSTETFWTIHYSEGGSLWNTCFLSSAVDFICVVYCLVVLLPRPCNSYSHAWAREHIMT